MYSTIIYGKGRNESFIKVQEILGQKQNGAQEDKYQQRTASHNKLNKNIEQQHRPQQKLGELGCLERLAVPASCTTPAMFMMLFIVNDMYIEYSGFHSNGFSQGDTHYNFAQYFQDIIYWTQPIKTSSLCSPPHYFCLVNPKNKKFFWCGLNN